MQDFGFSAIFPSHQDHGHHITALYTLSLELQCKGKAEKRKQANKKYKSPVGNSNNKNK
jgi:hypothetical protein